VDTSCSSVACAALVVGMDLCLGASACYHYTLAGCAALDCKKVVVVVAGMDSCCAC